MGSWKERHEVTGGQAPGAPRRRTSEAHVHQGHHSGARAPVGVPQRRTSTRGTTAAHGHQHGGEVPRADPVKAARRR